jgi:serine phosphatase RsbU (regulator of sigma subunit)
MIRTFLRIEKDFVALVARVNAFIKDNLPKGTFFAGVFGYLDLSKDAFFYINCGVPTIMLYSPAFDTFIEVQGEGRILGFVKDVAPYLKPRRLALTPGSAIVASTDGLLDSENLRGERFGKERLRRSVHERLGLTAAEISSGSMGDLLSFTDQRQDDDVTLFVMKLNSTSRDVAAPAEPRSAT